MLTRSLVLFAMISMVLAASGQRQYADRSALSSGKWIKVAVDSTGVYKVDAAFLAKAGFPETTPSSSIRLYGNGGAVLPESNAAAYTDDIAENAIHVVDGGDGTFSGSDYFLFYAPGPNRWIYDTLSSSFRFVKNPYSSSAFYFITLADGAGKRIVADVGMVQGNMLLEEFDEHYHHELDSINFLKSGKEWFGEDMSNAPGRKSLREFNISMPGILAGKPITLVSEVAGRSSFQSNAIPVSINGQLVLEHSTPSLMGTVLEPFANLNRRSATAVLNQSGIRVSYLFKGGSVNAEAWINWFDLFFHRSLSMQGVSQLLFRSRASMAAQSAVRFNIKEASGVQAVWDVTDPLQPIKQPAMLSGNELQFSSNGGTLREYIAFNDRFPFPRLIGALPNQNLHGLAAKDMLVVADKAFLSEANRLAAFHQQRDGMRVEVVDVEQVYNEFASGTPDPTAIRNFLKMRYDRAGSNAADRPRYLLLFGGASYVYKEKAAKKNNLVPSFQSASSLDPLTSYVSDDYFGLLDDQDDINSNQPAALLDVGIGRIPVRTQEQARMAVDKILNYHLPATLGAWRNNITLVADDEDYNIHFDDAELHAKLVEQVAPVAQVQKIYLDAFDQERSSGGSAYPAVNNAITAGIEKGTLIWNYSGHGGSERLAQESVLERAMVREWKNQGKLPLFITATCDFAPFDDPDRFSLGEDLLVGRSNGAVGLLTTTRLVFASSNRVINNNYFRFQLMKSSDNRYPSLGEALRLSKNYTIANTGDFINVRKFTLLGDPAMHLAFPALEVRNTVINGKPVASASDTLRALSRYTMDGEVRTPSGLLAADFNGQLFVKVYDKPLLVETKANDPLSKVAPFETWEHILYDGKVRVEQGKFSYSFVVPKDIQFNIDKARISYYAENGVVDASGVEDRLFVGGLGNTVNNDGEGPRIEAYLDNEQFKNGDRVGENPLLIVKLFDASGINLSGIGIGHDITAVIDGNFRETIRLNPYFQAENAGDLRGTVRLLLPTLAEGRHTVLIRAWDVFNNSSTTTIECRVEKQKEILIKQLINYPNPFSQLTRFRFQLEGPAAGAQATIRVFSLEGKLVRELSKTINEVTVRYTELDWDGRDERGNSLPKGMYVYQLTVRGALGQLGQKMRNLIIH